MQSSAKPLARDSRRLLGRNQKFSLEHKVGGFGFGFAAAAAMRQEIIGSNISILVVAVTPTGVICRGS